MCFSIVRQIVRVDKSVLNDEDENSNTALHLAAQYGHNKVADILLELGADVSARSVHSLPLRLSITITRFAGSFLKRRCVFKCGVENAME